MQLPRVGPGTEAIPDPNPGLCVEWRGQGPAVREGFGDLSHWRPCREMELAQMGLADSEGQHRSSGVGNIIQTMGKTLKNSLRSPKPLPKMPPGHQNHLEML